MYEVTPAQRFWRRVKMAESGCWLWTASLFTTGYGCFTVDGKTVKAHRFAYELFLGPIPPESVLDHQCHNADLACLGGNTCAHRRCVNPAHLEAVDQRTNLVRSSLTLNGIAARKTHCVHGHLFTPETTRMYGNRRACLICKRERGRATDEKRRAARSGLRVDSA